MARTLRAEIDQLARSGTLVSVKRGQLLLREGEVAEHAFLVRTGALRSFTTPNAHDVTFQFFLEGSLVSSFESFRTRTPSRFSVEAIEDTEVVRLSRPVVTKALADAGTSALWSEALARRLETYMRRVESLITESALERYQRLRRESPELVARVHQHYLASYLGITPVSLSRLRRKLAR
ncbi:MAG: Crp/Fnr family transcriptional regulator [Archangiaceae bacterium]|nr:Crp/Fnr family transcriptional regulator [Archangiaceae bacterium]